MKNIERLKKIFLAIAVIILISMFVAIYGVKLLDMFEFVVKNNTKEHPVKIEETINATFDNETQTGITGCRNPEDVSLQCKLSEIIGENKEFSLIKNKKYKISKQLKISEIPIEYIFLKDE